MDLLVTIFLDLPNQFCEHLRMDIAPWCISGGMVWDGYLRAGWGTEHRTDLVKPPMTVASQRPIADWVLLLFSPFAIWCKDIDEDDFVDDFYRYSGFDGFMATVMMIIVIISSVFIKLMNCDYRFDSLNIDVKDADLTFKYFTLEENFTF